MFLIGKRVRKNKVIRQQLQRSIHPKQEVPIILNFPNELVKYIIIHT